MLSFLVLAATAGQSPAFVVENKCPAFAVTNCCHETAAPPKKMVAVKVPAAGWHVHRCPNGHEWSHTDSMAGNVAAHTCPACGLQSWVPEQRGVRIVMQEAAPAASSDPLVRYTLPTFTGSSCPGGNCPSSSSSRGLFGWRR
jgi:hypothetical protein